MIGIIFGSSMGNTEAAANFLAENLGVESKVLNISDVSAADINSFDKLILGSSTWGSGDLQDDWDAFDFDALEVSGKTVALFGMGDSSSYSDTYCNAMGILYKKMKEKGANIVGSVSTDGYEFDESEAVVDGKFVGLALDADNQGDDTEPRILAWIEVIKSHFA